MRWRSLSHEGSTGILIISNKFMKKTIILCIVCLLLFSANFVVAQTIRPEYLFNPIIEPVKEKLLNVIVKNEDPIPIDVKNEEVNVVGQVEVSNMPDPCSCKNLTSSTKVLGSPITHVRAEDLVAIPIHEKVLYASYEGSGEMNYLFARGGAPRFGVEIIIDGQMVSKTDAHHLHIISGSEIFRQVDPNGSFEVTKSFPFREKLEIYLYNNDADDITGGAHIEIETID